MFRQVALAHARLAIEPMQRCLRCNPHQVPVALFVLGQHQQMIVVVSVAGRAVILVLADIKLTPQNRLDPALLRRLKKVHSPIDIPVVGHRDRLLPQVRDPVHQLGQVASPIQQRVLRMQMQMRKFSHRTTILAVGRPRQPDQKPVEIRLN